MFRCLLATLLLSCHLLTQSAGLVAHSPCPACWGERRAHLHLAPTACCDHDHEDDADQPATTDPGAEHDHDDVVFVELGETLLTPRTSWAPSVVSDGLISSLCDLRCSSGWSAGQPSMAWTHAPPSLAPGCPLYLRQLALLL